MYDDVTDISNNQSQRDDDDGLSISTRLVRQHSRAPTIFSTTSTLQDDPTNGQVQASDLIFAFGPKDFYFLYRHYGGHLSMYVASSPKSSALTRPGTPTPTASSPMTPSNPLDGHTALPGVRMATKWPYIVTSRPMPPPGGFVSPARKTPHLIQL